MKVGGCGENNYLKVIRPYGTIIKYSDFVDNDFKLDSINLTTYYGETIIYKSKDIGKKILEIGQSQFDDYLKKIIHLKIEKGLRNIKKE